MIFILQLIALVGGFIVVLTVVALLNDQPRRSSEVTFGGWLRHHLRRLALVLMGAGGAMAVLSVLTGQYVSLDVAVLLAAIALRQISHPKGWLRFLTAPSHKTGAPLA